MQNFSLMHDNELQSQDVITKCVYIVLHFDIPL